MKFLDYVMAPWEGNDGKLALRPIMATATFIGMIKFIETHPNPDTGPIYALISLIGILLGLSTTQNIAEKAIAGKVSQSANEIPK